MRGWWVDDSKLKQHSERSNGRGVKEKTNQRQNNSCEIKMAAWTRTHTCNSNNEPNMNRINYKEWREASIGGSLQNGDTAKSSEILLNQLAKMHGADHGIWK